MSGSAFQQGAQIQLEGKCYILLRKLDPDLWQTEEALTKRIEVFTHHQLLSLYAEGKLTFSTSASSQLPSGKKNPVDYSQQHWAAAKMRRAYVMAVIDLPGTRARITRVIEDVWQKLRQPERPPNAATVLRWKGEFQRASGDIAALVDKQDKKGNTTSRYPREVQNFIQQAIESVYLTPERKSIQDTIDSATILVKRENHLRSAAMQLPRPTRRLITRMIRAIPAFDLHAARYGHISAVKKFRACLARRTTAVPLERAEVDHTRLDLMVIDDRTGLPLGRPWLTVCIDDYSRCILGIHISFEPPSYFTVARCLKHALLPKVTINQDCPSVANPWAAHGIMRELVVDNGLEFHSTSLENACLSIGIEIHYAPRKTPWFKGKIERFQGTLNRAVAHGTPGTTFGNILEKDEYDPSKHAVVRFSVIKEVICKWICDVYHQKTHRTLGVAPAVMWSNAISPEEILVPDDPARLEAILGRSEQRRLTHKGIELYGLFYNSSELTALRRQRGDKLDVDVRVDASDLGQIIVLSPDKRQMFTVPALHAQYAAGLSEYQHRICKRYAALELNQSSQDAWLQAKADIADLIEHEFMHKKQKTRTRIARYQGGDVSRPAEAALQPIACKSSSVMPQRRPAPEVVSLAAEVTSATVTEKQSPASSETPKRRFAPLYRERNPQFSEAEEEASRA